MSETIQISLTLEPRFWDRPPEISVIMDQTTVWTNTVAKTITVEFHCQLVMYESHCLLVHRQGKTADQTNQSLGQDQLLLIKQLRIDNTDVGDLLYTHSEFEPEYPEPWASQQCEPLPKIITGETVLGHNGTWRFGFTSPFYKFLFDTV